MIPLVGFLPAEDERVRGTIAAVERDLMQNGLVLRYRPNECEIDGLPGNEGVFLPCSFWLVFTSSAGKKMRAFSSNACLICAMTSVCSRRNTIR